MTNYTPMQVRTAILNTAALFEASPHLFNFWKTRTPPDCGTPGCAVGYMAYFLSAGEDWRLVAAAIGFRSVFAFYQALDEFDTSWEDSAQRCAKALRAYVAKYLPETALDPAYLAFKAALVGTEAVS